MQVKLILATTILLLLAVSAGAQTYKTLYNFDITGPINSPYAGLVFDKAGNLYGVAAYSGGGYYSDGGVFKLTPSPRGWNFDVYVFDLFDNPLGRTPIGGLAIDEGGNIYGTNSLSEDDWGCGTIYKLYEVLHQFARTDGCGPLASLTYRDGWLWGTTAAGGTKDHGTVFKIATSGDGFQSYSFLGREGAEPMGGVNQWGYGAASAGGGAALGTIYWVDPDNRLVRKHSFQLNGKAGYAPMGELLAMSIGNVRTMYGTTSAGGQGGGGTVYRITESPLKPETWRMTVLHSFSGADGLKPLAGLAADQAGNLYGTTSRGGEWDCGTVFKLSPVGQNNRWKHTVIHSFNKYNTRGDGGCYATSGVILGRGGNLYGTTLEGGCYGGGTVYKIVP